MLKDSNNNPIVLPMVNPGIDQREVISNFIKEDRPQFNPTIFTRDEDEIVAEIMNVVRSCERDTPYFGIKVKSFRVVDDYEEINMILKNYYDDTRKNKSKARKAENPYDCINLNESIIKLIIVTYHINDRTEEDELDVIIAIPRIVDKYYFRINGIDRSTIWQIVDSSTYNNGTSNAKVPSITFKFVFMACRVIRYYNNLVTTKNENLKLTYYHSVMFSTGVSCAEYILAKYGFYESLRYMGLNGAITISNTDPDDDNLYTFNKDIFYVSVSRVILDNNPFVQSVVYTIVKDIIPGITYESIFRNDYWVRVLGAQFSGAGMEDKILSVYAVDPKKLGDIDTYEKGEQILSSVDTIYDISTKEAIRLPENRKETTYDILLWIMREFNYLRLKDNLNMTFKKIRFSTHIASIYAFRLAKGIYRITDMGKKVTIVSIRKAIKSEPMRLLNDISSKSGMATRNMVTDMDSLQAAKFTYKGISGLGETSNNSIPNIYRTIQPSHIGKVDLDSSSDGNPGITGTICPYAPIKDGYFEDFKEPDFWEDEFLSVMDEYKKANNYTDALIFEQNVLGVDNAEKIAVQGEIIASMKQIIKPHLYANEVVGETISSEDIVYGY